MNEAEIDGTPCFGEYPQLAQVGFERARNGKHRKGCSVETATCAITRVQPRAG